MQGGLESLVAEFSRDIGDYLPNVLAAVLLLGAGALIGWFVKRLVIQLCLLLRLHRFFRRFRWGVALSKGDVRHAFFEFVGNLCFVVIFLVFFSNALSVMKLDVLSRLLEEGILLLPRTLAAVAIFGAGWLLAGLAAGAVQKALLKERVPRATLIARFAKAMLLLFFSGMAVAELGIARDVVIVGFTVLFATLAALVIVLAAYSGREIVKKVFEGGEE